MGNVASWIWVFIPLGAFVLAAYRSKLSAHRRENGLSIDGKRQVDLLSSENERLSGQILRLEERIAVLERIATDQPSRLSAEIENLR
jgi:hypothetical protein